MNQTKSESGQLISVPHLKSIEEKAGLSANALFACKPRDSGTKVKAMLPHSTILLELPVFWPHFHVRQERDVSATDAFARMSTECRGTIMSHTNPATPDHDHGCTRSIGSNQLYGGWSRAIDDDVRVFSPLYLGVDVKIRGSSKVGPLIAGDRVTIGSNATAMGVILGSRTELDDGVQANHAVIGDDVYVGPGTLLLHKPLVPKPEGLRLRDEDRELTLSGITKLGPRIGDRCRIGAGTIIEPATVLFPGLVVPHGVVVPAGIYRTQKAVEERMVVRRS